MNAPIWKYQNIIVPITVPNPATYLQLPDQPNLRDSRIVAIEFQDINILPVCSDLITPNVPLGLFRNAFITLVHRDVNNIVRIPVQNFQTIMDNSNAAPTGRANLFYRDLMNMNIYFNKCYIEYPAALVPAANCAFNIGVYYLDSAPKV